VVIAHYRRYGPDCSKSAMPGISPWAAAIRDILDRLKDDARKWFSQECPPSEKAEKDAQVWLPTKAPPRGFLT
jgi:hypothetical protein